MTAMFWTPRPSEASGTFQIEATDVACVGPPEDQFFMGGVAMAAAIEALQTWSGKPLLWTTIQFLNHGMYGDQLEITVEKSGGGRSVVQAMAKVMREGHQLQTLIAALGERPGEPDQQFEKVPNDVPAPEECALKQDDAFARPGNLIDQFERRTALEDPERGLEWMWMRPKFRADITAPLLALMSDFFLGAHERSRGGTSLDNTIRICALRPTEWVLSVTQIASFSSGAVQGYQRQFAEDGTLLSISSQTGLLPRRS